LNSSARTGELVTTIDVAIAAIVAKLACWYALNNPTCPLFIFLFKLNLLEFMYVKICGITKPDQAVAIAEKGVNALGFICVPSTPRYVDAEQIVLITDRLPANVDRVGVFMDASVPEILQIVQRSGLNCVQLHGSESPQFCEALKAAMPTIELIKALRIRTPESLERSREYYGWVDTILLDAYDPKLAGGTGKTIDWEILENFHPSCSWWLAGGLSPDNVAIALERLHPDGIDVSSGVETAPGNKDITRVRELISVVRQATFDLSS
jgi:phosphoribosylanthranilate isomerase